MTVLAAVDTNRRGADHFAGGSALLDRGEATLQMQRARAAVVVETICCIGLLLRLHNDGPRSQRMYRAAGNVNHLALVDVDPVKQLFRALVMDALLELSARNAGLQSESDLRSGLGMGYVPAFGFAPGLAEALRGFVVGVYLDREFVRGKEKLQKQRKALWVARGRAHELGTEFFAQV